MSGPAAIDLTKLSFPSDNVTIKDLRKHFPSQVDVNLEVNLFSATPSNNSGDWFDSILTMERDLARIAYCKATGTQCPPLLSENDAALTSQDLVDLYIRFGIASGPHHAEQLVRGIESQAIDQARQHLGRRP